MPPKRVPASSKKISEPSASKIISPATSNVRSPEERSISVPSIVRLSATKPPLAVTLLKTASASVVKS